MRPSRLLAAAAAAVVVVVDGPRKNPQLKKGSAKAGPFLILGVEMSGKVTSAATGTFSRHAQRDVIG